MKDHRERMKEKLLCEPLKAAANTGQRFLCGLSISWIRRMPKNACKQMQAGAGIFCQSFSRDCSLRAVTPALPAACLLIPAHWGYLWLPLTRAAIRLSVCELIQPIQKALHAPTHHSPALLPHQQHILGALHAQMLSCTPASLLSSLLTALCFCHYINHVLLWNEAYSHRQKAF